MPHLLLALLCSASLVSASHADGRPAAPPDARLPSNTSAGGPDQAAAGTTSISQRGGRDASGGRSALRQQPVHKALVSMKIVDTSKGGPATTTAAAHEVEHVYLLNREAFWWLMGTLVLCVGIAVVRMEIGPNWNNEDAPLARPGSCSGPLRIPLTPPDRASPTPPIGVSPSTTASGYEEDISQAHKAGCTPRTTQKEHGRIWNLAVCAIMLNITQLCWGVTQEFLMTQTYVDAEGNVGKFGDAQFVVLCNRIAAFALAGFILKLRGCPLFFEGFSASVWPATANCFASWCQYRSLLYISFALQTAAKSAKLFPVLVLDSIRGKRHTLVDYAETLVIICALIVFALETEVDAQQSRSTTAMGILLICGLVMADSVTPHCQDIIFKMYPAMNAIEMCFSMSCLAMVFLGLMELMTGQMFTNISFLCQHPDAMVHLGLLSVTSFLTQYFISYTIAHFGPVVFALLASLRQVTSVGLSVVLFNHQMSSLAVIAMILIVGTVLVRVLRPLAMAQSPPADTLLVSGQDAASTSSMDTLRSLMLCAFAIHVLYCFYSVAQEFLATHTFNGKLFEFPLFLVAVNHTFGAIFAMMALRVNAAHLCVPDLHLTTLPAFPNLVATFFQHQALYAIRFPSQTLMKTLKVIPVMLAGTVLRNRTYSMLDYGEGVLITILVAYFVWDFQLDHASVEGSTHDSVMGILLMVGYLCTDSFTSNFEDFAYQRSTLDPGQMLFGMEAISSVVAWTLLIASGEMANALAFIMHHQEVCLYVGLLALASGSGAYTCTVTVRIFGPAVFTLLMTSRQILSLIISVLVFQHTVNWVHTMCLAVVATLILTSSLRRVSMMASWQPPRARPGLPPDASLVLGPGIEKLS